MNDVSDSTDWLNTPISDLAPLDSALRCQVCKDFFTTPMITSCSHTFCSLCIRRYLSQEGRCPACRESDQEMKLRRNWAVEELVAHFSQARSKVLEFARSAVKQKKQNIDSERPKKRRRVDSTTNGTALSARNTRSQTRRTAGSVTQASQDPPVASQDSVPDSDEEGSIYQTSPQQPRRIDGIATTTSALEPGTVSCPCCSRPVKESNINSHLDRCITGQPTTPDPPSHTTTTTTATKKPAIEPGSIAYHHPQTKPSTPQPRLPTINYTLFSDTALRKKLRDLGIPSTGSKDLMRRRHTEWMNLWNANCDSASPRPKRELLRELDTWERTLGRQFVERRDGSAAQITGNTGVMVREFDRDAWAKENKPAFDDLIRRAREKRSAAAAVQDAGEVLAHDDTTIQPAPSLEVVAGADPDLETEVDAQSIQCDVRPDLVTNETAEESMSMSMTKTRMFT